MSDKQTNSYEKYYKMMKYVDALTENHKRLFGADKNRPVVAKEISAYIGIGDKQTIRCMREIASVDDRYRLTTIKRSIALIKRGA